MATRHLTPIDLAARWNVSHRTIERWRATGGGPRFLRLCGRVAYRLEDIEAYETQQLRTDTTEPSAGAASGGAP